MPNKKELILVKIEKPTASNVLIRAKRTEFNEKSKQDTSIWLNAQDFCFKQYPDGHLCFKEYIYLKSTLIDLYGKFVMDLYRDYWRQFSYYKQGMFEIIVNDICVSWNIEKVINDIEQNKCTRSGFVIFEDLTLVSGFLNLFWFSMKTASIDRYLVRFRVYDNSALTGNYLNILGHRAIPGRLMDIWREIPTLDKFRKGQGYEGKLSKGASQSLYTIGKNKPVKIINEQEFIKDLTSKHSAIFALTPEARLLRKKRSHEFKDIISHL